MTVDLNERVAFESRHNGPDEKTTSEMLKAIGASSLQELIAQTVPDNIRLKENLKLPDPLNEFQFLKQFKK